MTKKSKSDNKKKAIHRLKIIEGKVRGLIKMVEEDTYCMDVLVQSLSIQESLKSFDGKMLEGHLSSCVVKQMQGMQKEKAIEELLKLFKLSKK